MALKIKDKTSLSEGSVAKLQDVKQKIMQEICDDGFSSSLTVPKPLQLQPASTSSGRTLGLALGGRGKSEALTLPSAESSVSAGFPGLDKSLKKVKDPVIAASCVRKCSMKPHNQLLAKTEQAQKTCRNVLDLIQDDFDDEETRSNDSSVQEIRLRFQLLKLLTGKLVPCDSEANLKLGNEIVTLMKDDVFFRDSNILPEDIMAMEYMDYFKNTLELL